jgi:hypothetical protein
MKKSNTYWRLSGNLAIPQNGREANMVKILGISDVSGLLERLSGIETRLCRTEAGLAIFGDEVERLKSMGVVAARSFLATVLDDDPDFKRVYRDNVALCISDNLSQLGYKPNVCKKDRDAIAEKVLALVFGENLDEGD